ncbi:RES family NAD+ phosphorylase [Solirubrobacter soli]|uniref:RES family NAD+ phosphorylase n=1 Tax=Solirubrobacter soli TaxID=363832 RepID=UPI00041982A3|nr:RES family NAD+ phosphorylase [Solirubrobacter soli]
MKPELQVVRPDGPLHRVGRAPDAWALAPWTYAGPDNTFGNRYDDPEGEYRVLYAAGQRRGAFLETLARFRADLQLIAELATIDDDPEHPTIAAATVPREWLETRCVGAAEAASLDFVDISHSRSLAHLRHALAHRLIHYGLDDLDAGDIRKRTPRALTQEVSRYVFERPEAFAGIRYLSRLGDELANWGIFEGSELDAILEDNEAIEPDDPDFVSALETLNLTLD